MPARLLRVPLAVALAAALLAALLAAPPAVAPAEAQTPPGGPAAPGPVQPSFGDPGGFASIVPPGQKGVVTVAEAPAAQAGQRPRHVDDQLRMYEQLVFEGGLPAGGGFEGVTDGDQDRFFKDGSFGSRGAVERTYSPTAGLTITRDAAFGVPHIVGETRAAAMFGAGYAGAEDRLFLMDVLRHYGRGRLSEFLGASEANKAMDRAQVMVAPYTEAELVQQVADICASGPEGQRACEDLDAYTAGVNAYIAEARSDPRKLPAEYPALQVQPRSWVPADTVAIASLVGGIFGRGGGNEVASGRFLSQLQARYGADVGRRVWSDFRSADDPEAPVTTTRRFPYNQHDPVDQRSTALLDLPSAAQAVRATALPPLVADGPLGPIDLRPSDPSTSGGMSNAILATGAVTDGGKPIAVFGPQTGYFSPQLLVEMDIHGPGISARGVAFAGTNIYVQLGRGRDYAWSATSASADNVDQWVLELCNPDGSTPSASSVHYRHEGQCKAMDRYTHRQVAKPTAGGVPSSPAPGNVVFDIQVERSVYGPVVARGTVDGKPVAVATQRSTYGAELRSAIGFQRINDPTFMSRGVASFNDAFDGVDYTFNWFYVDGTDVAYKHSCRCPIRDPRTDPDLPTWGTGEWDWTGRFLSPAQQPQDVNPASGHLSNWNNKQAPGFRANDAQYSYSSTYRSEFLAKRMEALIRSGRKLTRADMVNVMIDAGTVDLNGQEIYPLVLRVLGQTAPAGEGQAQLQAMRDRLAAWVADGGHRRDLDRDGDYDHAVAVAIGDALVRPVLAAVFRDELGDAALPQTVEDHPRLRVGSAYNGGQMGFLHKDLRQVLGDPVEGRRSRTYCGQGSPTECRAALWAAMTEAARALTQSFSSADVDAWVYDDAQDRIRHSAVGLTSVPDIQWQNRPTYQQVVQVGSRSGRISGSSRTVTAAAVSRHAFRAETSTVVVASAASFADAVAGTPLAARRSAPLLLAQRGALTDETAREVRRLRATTAILLGGTAALGPQVEADLRAAGVTTVHRVGGTDRFDTARLIAETATPNATKVVLASGESFADALAAGPFAARDGRPILLTSRGSLPAATRTALEGVTDVVVAGGTGAVGAAVEAVVDQGRTVRRVAGGNRYETGRRFTDEAISTGLSAGSTYAVTGADFPDALAAGAGAVAGGGVLLLVPPGRLASQPAAAAFVAERRTQIARLWLVGGQRALTPALRADLEAALGRL